MAWIPLESLSPHLGLVQVEAASGWRLGACPGSPVWSVSRAEPACYQGVIVLVIWQHWANVSHQGWAKNRSCAVGPRKISSRAHTGLANQAAVNSHQCPGGTVAKERRSGSFSHMHPFPPLSRNHPPPSPPLEPVPSSAFPWSFPPPVNWYLQRHWRHCVV